MTINIAILYTLCSRGTFNELPISRLARANKSVL